MSFWRWLIAIASPCSPSLEAARVNARNARFCSMECRLMRRHGFFHAVSALGF
jgi:hypothetical protein